MFAIYITLTKGQRPSFKKFIKPPLGQRLKGFLTNSEISNQIFEDKVKCIRLLRCFFEAGDNEIYRYIENNKFPNKEIKISNVRLSPIDMECVTAFLTSSSYKKWEYLSLCECCIQDYGVHVLHRGLKIARFNITITCLDLSSNLLSGLSSSAISEITISCKVKILNISGFNTVGEDKSLYSIITDPSSVLEELYMYSTMLSSNGAIKLFNALTDGNKLRKLNIHTNNVSDEAYYTILKAMRMNTSLIELVMWGNPIGEKCALDIIQALKHNNTLQLLQLSNYRYSQF